MGVDELFWGKGKCLTVVSDLIAGEPPALFKRDPGLLV
jgi:hypothetical protein